MSFLASHLSFCPYGFTREFLPSYLQLQLKQALKAVSTLRKILMLIPHSLVSMAVGVTLVQVRPHGLIF